MKLIELFETNSSKSESSSRMRTLTHGNSKSIIEKLTDSSGIDIKLPKYLQDQYEFWHYSEKFAKAFDDKFNRKDDNPIVNRGLNQYTLDWMINNQNTPTAYYRELLPLDPRKVAKIEGYSGEHGYIEQPEHKERISSIAKDMKERGFDMKSPILIHVTKNGPRIVEGNHRVRAAIEAGIWAIPTEWQWLGGTEMNRLHHPVQYVSLKNESKFKISVSKILKEWADSGDIKIKHQLKIWFNAETGKILFVKPGRHHSETLRSNPEWFGIKREDLPKNPGFYSYDSDTLNVAFNNNWVRLAVHKSDLNIESNNLEDIHAVITELFASGEIDKIDTVHIDVYIGNNDYKNYKLDLEEVEHFFRTMKIRQRSYEGLFKRHKLKEYKKSALTEERIVQTAFRLPDGTIIPSGPFHNWEVIPDQLLQGLSLDKLESGFLTDEGNFLTRQEAARLTKMQKPERQKGALHSFNVRGLGKRRPAGMWKPEVVSGEIA